MARIRSVKPEFWTDEDVTDASRDARLLFIGLWNIADDAGRLWDKPRQIKAQVLPTDDDVDVAALIEELVGIGLLSRWVSADGRNFLQVRNFSQHQRPQHPTASKIDTRGAKCISSSTFTNPHEESGGLIQERRGEEGSGEERTSSGSRGLMSAHEVSGDDLNDTLLTVCGIEPETITASARSAYEKSVRELQTLGASTDEVMERAMAFRRTWPDATLTPTALVRRWAECMNGGSGTHNDRVLAQFAAGAS